MQALTNTALKQQGQSLDPMDARLEQIREIILGGQFDRLENKQRNLSLRIDTHQNQVLTVVEELREQMTALKAEVHNLDLKNLNTLQQEMEAMLSRTDASLSEWRNQMSGRLEQLESQYREIPEAMEELKKEQSVKTSLGKGSEALSNLVERIKHLEEAEGKNRQELRQELQSLRKRQERFETNISDILDNLADAITEKLQKEQEQRRVLSEETGALKNLMHDGLQGLLDEQERMKKQTQQPTAGNDRAMEEWQQRMERKLEDSVLRMETRMSTMLEMQSKYQTPVDPEAEKKKALKATLKKLSDLLDD